MKKIFVLIILSVASYFTSNAQCTADFGRNPRTACIGSPFVFYDLSTGGSTPKTWEWDFGSGATPATYTGQTPPTVTYSTTGTKTITLTYKTNNGGCTDVQQRDVDVVAQPTVSFTSNSPQCVGQQFNFTYTGSASLSYSWDFGLDANPRTSTTQSPQGITYSSSGTKTVTLTINNGTCTQTSSQTVSVSTTPTVSFSSTAPKCTGLDVDFSNTGTSSGVTYSWDFGSGASPTTSISENPANVIYSTSGIKTVSLTITNSTTSCSVTETNTINIYQTPTSDFTSNEPVCENTAVDFTNNSTTGIGVVYNWDFGSGATPATSTSENPSNILYNAAGNKTVTLTVINENKCSAISSSVVDILSTPKVSFTSTAPKCTGLDVDFTNTGTTNDVDFSWNFGSGANPTTSVLENPANVIYSTSGNKTISLTLTDTVSNCSVTATNTINIYQTPISSFTSNAPVCENTAVDFTNNSTTGIGVAYNWDFGKDAIPASSTSENPTGILYSTSETKTVTLIVTNENLCSATSSVSIDILSTPKVSFTSTAPKCTGLDVDFTNTGTSNDLDFSWNFGSGASPATSVLENPANIIYSTSGIKTISLTLTDTVSNCSVTATNTINIYQTPISSFTSNAPVCENTAVDFTNNSTTGIGVSYNWDFGKYAIPASSTSQTPNGILYGTSGTKTVTLIVTNENLCSATSSISIDILTTPKVSFTSTAPKCTGLDVDFTNTGTSNDVDFSWNFGSGASSATSVLENPANIIYSTSGIKTISLTLTDTVSNCSVTATNTINIYQTPSVSFTSTAPQCVASDVDFENTGSSGENWTYLWDFGLNALPKTASSENPSGIKYSNGGNKIVTLTISDGVCMHIDTNTIFINSLPIVDAGKDTTICADRNVQIGTSLNLNYTYKWFPSSTLNNANISSPISSPIANITNYVLVVTDKQTACHNIDSVQVTMLLPLNVNAGVDVEICRNESIQIGASLVEGQTYSWLPVDGLNSSTSPNPIANPDSTTTYTLTVSGSGCDVVTDVVTVLVNQLPNIDAGLNDTITHGSNIQLIVTGGVQYEWDYDASLSNIGIYNPIAYPEITTTYNVVGTDIYGCKNSDLVTVFVITPSVWTPSAFTPDDNGLNDVFYVRGEGINDFEFAVFNSWGESVFYSKDINAGWDGTKLGTNEKLPEGAYVYYVNGKLTNGEAVNVKGIINLIR